MRFGMTLLLAATAAFSLAGCNRQLPVKDSLVQYEAPAKVTSEQKAAIVVITDDNVPLKNPNVSTAPPERQVSGITGYSADEYKYNSKNQGTFAMILARELTEKNILNARFDPAQPPSADEIQITLNFISTNYNANFWRYDITAEMKIEHERRLFRKRYSVSTADDQNVISAFTTTAMKAKVLASRRLLNAVIPDIEQYVLAPPEAVKYQQPNTSESPSNAESDQTVRPYFCSESGCLR